MLKLLRPLLMLVLLAACPSSESHAQWRKIHDPSTILHRDGRYWMFSTGVGVQSLSSPDLKQWRIEPPVFDEPPAWVKEVVPTQRGHFWAPDLMEWRGRYLLYYSVSAFGKRTSAIALATSPTLNPNAEHYGWKDEAVVIQTSEADDFNAIDPAVIATPEGELWMAFGSFWSGIKLIQLDPETGKRMSPESPIHSVAWKDEIEAPAIYFHEGSYYLFVNWGRCCRGVRSTYNIRAGRSREITGPYVDRDGVNMLKGGGTLVLDTRGAAIGPGHAGFFERDGKLMLSYHYYDGERRGQAVLGINELRWDEAGWPVATDGIALTGRIAIEPNKTSTSTATSSSSP
jgi:arabinan endo-1,5-alpha-L-arabinosidase